MALVVCLPKKNLPEILSETFLSVGSDKAVVMLSKEKTLQTNPAVLLLQCSIYQYLFPVSIFKTLFLLRGKLMSTYKIN